jgi:hypothetical protein
MCLGAITLSGCERASSTPQGQLGQSVHSSGKSELYDPPVRIAQLEDRAITESSGIVASRRNPDLFWTHNDSGDGPVLYAFDRRGKSRGRWRVAGAQAVDWEDIAAGPGPQPGLSYLYIGDIGDNGSERESVTVYRVIEPNLVADDDSTTVNKQRMTEPAEAIRLKYPDGKHDAETLLVHPMTGDLYIITKNFDTSSGIYKLKAPLSTAPINTLTRAGETSVPNLLGGLITGGDISPDGRRVVLCDYLSAYEISLPGDSAKDFDNIWKQPFSAIELGPRQQGESICYRLDGNAILATSEKRPTPLIEVRRRK